MLSNIQEFLETHFFNRSEIAYLISRFVVLDQHLYTPQITKNKNVIKILQEIIKNEVKKKLYIFLDQIRNVFK